VIGSCCLIEERAADHRVEDDRLACQVCAVPKCVSIGEESVAIDDCVACDGLRGVTKGVLLAVAAEVVAVTAEEGIEPRADLVPS
jgi:hypothetical protein